jgi:transcriptional regulator GlxA family with amidase domain
MIGSSSTLPHALEGTAEFMLMVCRLAPECGYDARSLACALNISRRRLQRMFSATISRSPQAWLHEQRLLTARQMLHTAGSVKEVAFALGFSSSNQFSRDFKRHFGVAPSAFIGRAS